MRRTLIHRSAGVFVLGAAGCALQSIEVDDGLVLQQTTAPDMAAALGFQDPDGNIHLRDIVSTGSFPSDFRLTAPLPEPPAAALKGGAAEGLSTPPYAFAWITAVPRDHPPMLERMNTLLESSCLSETTDPEGPIVCEDELRSCSDATGVCASASMTCRDDRTRCAITEIHGDPQLLMASTRKLGGRAEDRALLFLTRPAPAGSYFAQHFAGGTALAQGYHLIGRRTQTADEVSRRRSCAEQAEDVAVGAFSRALGQRFVDREDVVAYLAITSFNAAHGTHHELVSDVDLDAINPDLTEAYRRFDEQYVEAVVTLQCALIGPRYTVLSEPGSQSLNIRISGPFVPPRVGDVVPSETLAHTGERIDWP